MSQPMIEISVHLFNDICALVSKIPCEAGAPVFMQLAEVSRQFNERMKNAPAAPAAESADPAQQSLL